MVKGKFENQISHICSDNDCKILLREVLAEALKKCPIVELKTQAKLYRELRDEVGYENLTVVPKVVLWIVEYFGDGEE